jgi:predicted phosphodiesterase
MDLAELFKNLEDKFKPELAVLKDNSEKIMFVGDIHGDLSTVRYIEENLGKYDKIICLGDYIDRGALDIEVSEEIARLKLDNDNLILLPGNHDACKEVYPKDWRDKLLRRFFSKGWDINDAYLKAFLAAPIAYRNTRYRVLALHGFIPVMKNNNYDIKTWNKANENLGSTEYQILWNDPELTGDCPGNNERGDGIFVVSNKDTLAFMKRNRLKIIVRSHKPEINRIFKLEDRIVVNIGSASYYGDKYVYLLPENKIKKI